MKGNLKWTLFTLYLFIMSDGYEDWWIGFWDKEWLKSVYVYTIIGIHFTSQCVIPQNGALICQALWNWTCNPSSPTLYPCILRKIWRYNDTYTNHLVPYLLKVGFSEILVLNLSIHILNIVHNFISISANYIMPLGHHLWSIFMILWKCCLRIVLQFSL